MTVAGAIVDIDLALPVAASLRAFYVEREQVAEDGGDLDGAETWGAAVVVCDAIIDAASRSRDACEELS